MVPKVIPHSNPLNTDYNIDKAQSSQFGITSAIPSFATFGLPSAWKPAFDWAVKNNAIPELFQAANATYLRSMPAGIGTLIEFMLSDYSYPLICEWSLYETSAQPLLLLSDAALLDSQILRDFPTFSRERSVERQFHNLLESHYLIALLTQDLSQVEQSDRAWFNTLKLWLLIHAMKRSLLGNSQDNWIRQAASKLRIACRQEGGWRKLLLLLKTSATDFDEISRAIIQKAEALRTRKQSSTLPPTERQFLQAVLNVAELKHAKDDQNQDSLSLISFPTRHQYADDVTYQPITEQIGEDDNSDFGNSRWISSEDDIAENLVQYDVDSEQSFTHQRLQGNSILLYCTEELQYLPLSWNKLNINEHSRLERWISECTTSPRPELRYLSAVVGIAINLGRSFQRTLDIQITKEIGEDWGLNPETLLFSRIPPRRNPGWRPKNSAHEAWITPAANKQSMSISPSIEEVLKERIAMCDAPKCVGELWNADWSETVEQLFRHEFFSVAPRVTGSMLASSLPQRIFQNSGDQTFARLLSSHPKTALPGACAYSSWSTDQVSCVMALGSVIEIPIADNAVGSMLDPIESLLINSIQSASQELEKLKFGQNLIAFHNAYSVYLTVSLLAATGGRPVSDPFESVKYFDFDAQFVYVSDKSSSGLRQARIVPLPSGLCRIIQDDYLSHLTLLSQQLNNINPRLAEAIAALSSAKLQATMPFFFLLSEDALSWESISAKGIVTAGLFDWPLPLNHFRHRLSRQLRKNGLDPEIIDSILGHAETGSATHGDFSFRVWVGDMQLARPAMETAFSSLDFPRVHGWRGGSIRGVASSSNQSNVLVPIEFGASLRAKQRLKRAKKVVVDANLQIEQFLKTRELSYLSEIELDQLSQKLLFNRNGMPHANGHLKYRVLLKRIEREWSGQGKKARLSRRYLPIPEEKTPFTTVAPGALAIFKKIQDQNSNIPQTNIGRISVHDCAVIAVALLCIENRISDKELLTDILHARNFRLVVLKKIPYLEHAEKLKSEDGDIPTKRYRLSDHAAQFLDRIKIRPLVSVTHIPDVLVPITEILAESGRLLPDINAQSLVIALADLVDQVSVITMPGILAGYLAGRVRSFSLLWRDWARLELEYPIQIKGAPNDEEISGPFVSIDSIISASTATTLPRDISLPILQQNARTFLGDIRDLLGTDMTTSVTARCHLSRKDIARKIQDVIEQYDGRVSSTIQLLARWINSILFRKKGGKLIQLPSIIRYLAALSPTFKELGYSADLLSMDDEEITIFYSNILQSSKAKDTKYIFERLVDFHRWAKREYAVEDPDWQELPEIVSTAHVSPGLIAENEYQRALVLLLNVEVSDRRSRLAAPFLLMLCYRFGLRGGEALGMLRSDIDISDQLSILYVQNNRYRTLKTQTSRRQVPLLFNLSIVERDILSQWLAEVESIHGNNFSAGLFADDQTASGLMDAVPIKRRTIAALKIATSNDDINLHHARHSAANYVTLAITQLGLSIWGKASPLLLSSGAANAEAMLLGRIGQSRRKIWAVSRFLGHVRRETTCGNYLHFLGEMSDLYTSLNKGHSNIHNLKNAITLDGLPRSAEIDTGLLEQLEPKHIVPTPSQILKLMRLIARGKPILEAATSLGISDHIAKTLQSLLAKVGKKIKLSGSKLSARQIDTPEHLKLVWRLKEPTWNRLIKSASIIDQQESLSPDLKTDNDGIIEMIGATRQILLWEERHFALVAAFLDYMKIEAADYKLVRSNLTIEDFDQVIKRYGFDAISVSDMKKEKTFQMDVAYAGDGKYAVQIRCALVITESDSRVIRNGIEFLVAFIAFAIPLMHRASQSSGPESVSLSAIESKTKKTRPCGSDDSCI